MAAPAASRLPQLTGAAVDLQASVAVPKEPSRAELRNFYFREIQALFYGLVRAGQDGFYLGRLPLITFEPAVEIASGWEWPISDGLLAKPDAKEKGRLRITSENGRVTVAVVAFRHWLPADVYALTQKPVHRLASYLALGRLRRALGD